QTVESLVAQQHAVFENLRREQRAARRPRLSADLEHVPEVGREAQGERDAGRQLAIVRQQNPLVEPVLPKEALALEMNDALGCGLAAKRRKRPVGEVAGE